MRAALLIVALLTALVQTNAAFAHASLVRAEPSDGAIVAQAPAVLSLTFNEPVTPLVMRLIAPDGTATTPAATAANTTVTVKAPALGRGTHVLSWRVISADGHPVGGSLVFSVGEASARPSPEMATAGDPRVQAAFWAAKLVIYAAIFIGIGGVFFGVWIGGVRLPWLDRALTSVIVAGLLATPLSVGLQGLDALGLPLSALAQAPVWEAGLDTTYGLTAITLAFALFAALFSFIASGGVACALTLAAMLLAGLALALSGHASNAAPQMATRPSVFVHVVCVAFWIGALLPLAAAVRAGDREALARFTRTIPYGLAALVASAVILAIAQLDRPDALWTTNYGLVLSCKLALVAALLALAAANRHALAPRYQEGSAPRPLLRSVRVELGIAVIVFGLVALWRFTPPPRALAAAEPIEVHLHSANAMAHVTFMPVRARDPKVDVQVLDGQFNALKVKEVTVTLASPTAGIEAIRRPATLVKDARWRVDGVRLPVAGAWSVRVDLLIDDFTKLGLEDTVDLPRLP